MVIKPNDIVRVKLAGDVYKVKVVKVSPKTFLALMTQTKTKYRKVRKDQTGQMNLFDTVGNTERYVKVPYTVRIEKLIKIPKGKLVSIDKLDVGRGSDNDTSDNDTSKEAVTNVGKLDALEERVVDAWAEEAKPPLAASALDEMLAAIKK